MKELATWLARIRDRQRARPELFDALLTGRYGAYARHRLRFMLPRVLLRLATHAFEIFVLATVLPWEWFAPLLSYRASSALIGGGYWGFLERLRSHVRQDVRRRRYDRARRAIEAWLGLSAVLAALCVLGIATWTAHVDAGEGFTLIDAYGWACYLRLAFDLVARTYHAGIFALQRVYRPLASVLLPDVLELAFVVVAFRWLGPWSIPLGIVSLGALRAIWTVYYSHRAYQHGRVPAPRLRGIPRSTRTLRWGELGAAAVHALANGSAQVDALIILALTHAPARMGDAVPLSVLYYALRPLLGAAHGWTRVFYFDWKRLEAGAGRVFQPRFRGMLMRIAVVMALLVGATLGGVGTLLWGTLPWRSVGALLLLLVARMALSLEQLEAFSLGHHGRLARLSLLIVAVVLTLHVLRVSEHEVVVGAAAVIALSVLWSRRVRLALEARESVGRGLTGVLSRLSDDTRPVTVLFMRADRRTARADRLLRAFEARFPRVPVALASRAHLLAFAPSSDAPPRDQLIAALGGALSELVITHASTGREAAAQLLASDWFERAVGLDLRTPSATRDELVRSFRRELPEGHVLELDRARGSAYAGSLSWAARRAILREISTRAAGRRPRATRQSAFKIAVLAPHGVARVVFVAPRDAAHFGAFTRQVERSGLRATLRLDRSR